MNKGREWGGSAKYYGYWNHKNSNPQVMEKEAKGLKVLQWSINTKQTYEKKKQIWKKKQQQTHLYSINIKGQKTENDIRIKQKKN